MTVYVLRCSRLSIGGPTTCAGAGSWKCVSAIKGRLLVSDERPAVVESAWDYEKVTLLSFPDEAAYRASADSPTILEIAKDRKDGAKAVVILAKSIEVTA